MPASSLLGALASVAVAVSSDREPSTGAAKAKEEEVMIIEAAKMALRTFLLSPFLNLFVCLTIIICLLLIKFLCVYKSKIRRGEEREGRILFFRSGFVKPPEGSFGRK